MCAGRLARKLFSANDRLFVLKVSNIICGLRLVVETHHLNQISFHTQRVYERYVCNSFIMSSMKCVVGSFAINWEWFKCGHKNSRGKYNKTERKSNQRQRFLTLRLCMSWLSFKTWQLSLQISECSAANGPRGLTELNRIWFFCRYACGRAVWIPSEVTRRVKVRSWMWLEAGAVQPAQEWDGIDVESLVIFPWKFGCDEVQLLQIQKRRQSFSSSAEMRKKPGVLGAQVYFIFLFFLHLLWLDCCGYQVGRSAGSPRSSGLKYLISHLIVLTFMVPRGWTVMTSAFTWPDNY